MWLFNLLFSSLSQLWYVELRIHVSRSVSVSPLEFEIMGVDCTLVIVLVYSVLCASFFQQMYYPVSGHSLESLILYCTHILAPNRQLILIFFFLFSPKKYICKLYSDHKINPGPAEPWYTLFLQTVQIQISWLLKKPFDLDLHCLSFSLVNCISNLDQVICLAEN